MNLQLGKELAENHLDGDSNLPLRVAFALRCVERVAGLFEAADATRLLRQGLQLTENVPRSVTADAANELVGLQQLAAQSVVLASGHPGSLSIDGAGHAAVSATYALSKALNGRALDAANYAAYASVYSYASYAVTNPDAFASEYRWQVECLSQMLTPAVPSH